jgi:hypothetical protein
MAVGIRCAYFSMQGIAPMAAVYMYVTGGISGAYQIALADATAAILIALLCLLYVRYATTLFLVAWLLVLDHQYHDIPFDKEEQSH